MRARLELVRFALAQRLGRQFEPDAVRIEEIDRLHEAVVGDADDVDARPLSRFFASSTSSTLFIFSAR